MRGKKTVALLFLLLAILLLVVGIVFGKVKESNKPIQVSSGYVDSDGQFHESYTGSGKISGDADKASAAGTWQIVSFVLAGISAVGGAVTLLAGGKQK